MPKNRCPSSRGADRENVVNSEALPQAIRIHRGAPGVNRSGAMKPPDSHRCTVQLPNPVCRKPIAANDSAPLAIHNAGALVGPFERLGRTLTLARAA